jgi:hypothetical protein
MRALSLLPAQPKAIVFSLSLLHSPRSIPRRDKNKKQKKTTTHFEIEITEK